MESLLAGQSRTRRSSSTSWKSIRSRSPTDPRSRLTACANSRCRKTDGQARGAHRQAAIRRIGIIGVSAKRRNFGRTIHHRFGIRQGPDCHPARRRTHSLGVRCVRLRPGLVDEVLETGAARTLMLIPGGLGETEESKEIAARMIPSVSLGPTASRCSSARTAWESFPGHFLKTAGRAPDVVVRLIVSQSGAFLLTVQSRLRKLSLAQPHPHGQSDHRHHAPLHQSDEADVIAVYCEGFKDDRIQLSAKSRANANIFTSGARPKARTPPAAHSLSRRGLHGLPEAASGDSGAEHGPQLHGISGTHPRWRKRSATMPTAPNPAPLTAPRRLPLTASLRNASASRMSS